MSDVVLSQFKQEVKEEKSYSGRKLKIGIIGCGGISGAHMNAYKQQPDVEIIAACYLVPGRAKEKLETAEDVLEALRLKVGESLRGGENRREKG